MSNHNDKQSGAAATVAMVMIVGVSLMLMSQLSQRSQVALDRELHEAIVAEKAQVRMTVENTTDCKTIIPASCGPNDTLELKNKAGAVLVAKDGTKKIGRWNVKFACTAGTNTYGVFVSRMNGSTFLKDPLTKKELNWAKVDGFKLNCDKDFDDDGMLLQNTCYGGIQGKDALPYEIALQCADTPPPPPPAAPPAGPVIIGSGVISGGGSTPTITPMPTPTPTPKPSPVGGGYGGSFPSPAPTPAPTPVGGGGFGGGYGGAPGGGYPAPAPAPTPIGGGGFGGAPGGGAGGYGGGGMPIGGRPQAAGFDLSIFGLHDLFDLGTTFGQNPPQDSEAGYGGVNGTGNMTFNSNAQPVSTTSGVAGSDKGCFFSGHFCGDDQIEFPTCPTGYHVTFRYLDRYGWGGIDLTKYTLCKKDAI